MGLIKWFRRRRWLKLEAQARARILSRLLCEERRARAMQAEVPVFIFIEDPGVEVTGDDLEADRATSYDVEDEHGFDLKSLKETVRRKTMAQFEAGQKVRTTKVIPNIPTDTPAFMLTTTPTLLGIGTTGEVADFAKNLVLVVQEVEGHETGRFGFIAPYDALEVVE